MSDFKLNKDRYIQARRQLVQVELSPPSAEAVHSEALGLVASAIKANRALIAADATASLLTYHACQVERQLEDALSCEHTQAFSGEDREQLAKAVHHASDRLQRTEAYMRECRYNLAHIEQQLQRLQDLDDVVFVTEFL